MSTVLPPKISKEKSLASFDGDDIDKRGSGKHGTSASESVISVDSDELVGSDPQPFKLYDYLFRRHLYKPPALDSIATRRSVYDDPDLAPHYWPKQEYENIHRFDPKTRWTVREERVSMLSLAIRLHHSLSETAEVFLQALVRKIDWRVMLWAAITFSALNLDRNNLSQANSDNILGDLKLTTNGGSLGLS